MNPRDSGKAMQPANGHHVQRLPWNSATTSDIMAAGGRRHHVQALVEIDVTEARDRMRAWQARTGERISTTGWLACCLARALSDYPALNVNRLGARRVVQFDDVDVMVVVERAAEGERRGIPLVNRAANRKSLQDLHAEVRAAQGQPLAGDDMVLGRNESRHWLSRLPFAARLYPHCPAWVRGLLWRYLARNGRAAQRVMGTAAITSVGMFGHLPGWPLIAGVHTVELAVGSIVRKPWVVGDRIEPREILALTVLVDHDLVDGAAAARFVSHLGDLLQQAQGLAE